MTIEGATILVAMSGGRSFRRIGSPPALTTKKTRSFERVLKWW